MKFIFSYLDDLLMLAGGLCILYGLSLWNVVVTWIAGGVMLILFGVMLGAEKARKNAETEGADVTAK